MNAAHFKGGGVYFRNSALHAAGGPKGLAVRCGENRMRSAPDANGAFHLTRFRIEDGEIIPAHDAHNQAAPMPNDAGGFWTNRSLPEHAAFLKINRHDRAITLNRDIGNPRIRAEGDVGRLIAGPQPFQKPQSIRIVNVHLATPEARNHQKLAIGGEIQMVGVGDAFAAQDGASCGFDEKDFIGHRIGNQQFLAIRRQYQVMHFAQTLDPPDFLPCTRIDFHDAWVGRIEHIDQISPRTGAERNNAKRNRHQP